jgi:peptidoglycan/LPS O-acetylase OafA/YrhL
MVIRRCGQRDLGAGMSQIIEIEQAAKIAQGSKYSPALQSLRGIAALVVLIHHCTFYYDYDPTLKKAAEIIFNAHAAVILFFVLSGFVLTLSLKDATPSLKSFLAFYIRRAFRIYPALWVGCALAVTYGVVFHEVALPNIVAEWWWSEHRRELPTTLGSYLLLFGGVDTRLPLPIWTLFLEIVASIGLPFVAVVVRTKPKTLLLATVILSLLVLFGPALPARKLTFPTCFLIGAAIVPAKDWLAGVISTQRRAVILMLAGFVVLWFGRLPMHADYRTSYFASSPAIVEAYGAAMLIAPVWIFDRLVPALDSKHTVALGDISYSLYLIHMPLIGLFSGFLGEIIRIKLFLESPLIATVALFVLVLPSTMFLSSLSYRYIEVPSMRAGKRLSKAILLRKAAADGASVK